MYSQASLKLASRKMASSNTSQTRATITTGFPQAPRLNLPVWADARA
jgi:hypothetical protein